MQIPKTNESNELTTNKKTGRWLIDFAAPPCNKNQTRASFGPNFKTQHLFAQMPQNKKGDNYGPGRGAINTLE